MYSIYTGATARPQPATVKYVTRVEPIGSITAGGTHTDRPDDKCAAAVCLVDRGLVRLGHVAVGGQRTKVAVSDRQS